MTSESVTVDTAVCGWCGVARHIHTLREAAGEVQHVWAATRDQLTPLGESPQPGPPAQVIVAPAPDILLRQLLRDLGVITAEQYDGLRRA